jgi:Antitoxin-like ribbon-helix-helix
MARSKLDALQRALERKPAAASTPAEPAASDAAPGRSYKAPSREGKTNITAYLAPDYKASLRLIQSKRNRSLQSLMAEALNDLFAKYDVPTVSEE